MSRTEWRFFLTRSKRNWSESQKESASGTTVRFFRSSQRLSENQQRPIKSQVEEEVWIERAETFCKVQRC